MEASELLTARSLLTPSRVALVDRHTGARWSYEELNCRANRAANLLREMGVTKGDRVSILAHNGTPYIDLFYGVGKIGAILAPLNWRLASAELEYIAKDSEPRVLFCGPEFADTAQKLLRRVRIDHVVSFGGGELADAVDYDTLSEAASDEEPPRPALHGDDTYCLLYTSGTTGRPKGAMIPHRQIVWNCINTIVSWGLTADDVSPVFTPLFHAGGLFAFLTPLLYIGGRIVLFREFDADEILHAITDEGCTVILGVPTIFKMLMDTDGFTAADFRGVRFFISGGAPLPVELVREWIGRKGGVFRQGYGLTEVGPNCFSMTDEESIQKAGSVGKPIFHSRMQLLDAQGKDVAVGETGELCISGPHVCTGYWRNPDATAETLRDGWLHTGDMARRDEEGFYSIVGRFKDMIISGGENVYAAEVEAAVREHPAVEEAALIGMPDPQWGEVGLMVVVLRQGRSATQDELRAACTERLARFKVPKRFVFAESIPHSAYGKVVKDGLRKRYLDDEGRVAQR